MNPERVVTGEVDDMKHRKGAENPAKSLKAQGEKDI
jgi:hypothetical protein